MVLPQVAVVFALLLVAAVGHPTGVAVDRNPSVVPLFPTTISHAVVIVLENSEAANTLAKGPFLDYLATHYAYASQDYAVCHPSAPNYLALTSGATFSQCGTDTYHVFAATNIADELEAKSLTWGTFQESMLLPCDIVSTYPYAVKHDPFVFYKDIVSNTTRCDSHVLNFKAWNSDVNKSAIPNYAFITPNLKDDGHDTNVSYASNWLHGFLTPLVNKTWFAHTAFFIVYDEGTSNLGAGNSATGTTNTTGGGHIYFSVVSPLSVGVGNITNRTTHYSILTTIEWLLGISSTGHHDKASLWPPLKSAL